MVALNNSNESLNLLTLKYTPSEFERTKVTNSKHAYDVIRKFYFDDIHIYESFFILLLNSQNVTIGYAKISQGGVASTLVDTRIIAKYAIDSLAPKVILAHNHPSGNLMPSKQDITLTDKIKEGLKLLDIEITEHLVITDEYYYSFLDNGLL